jgi:hypothetical protein
MLLAKTVYKNLLSAFITACQKFFGINVGVHYFSSISIDLKTAENYFLTSVSS